jgi:hypothetical protein
MKQKRMYNEARMNVVQLSGKSQLLAESAEFEGTSGSPALLHGSYENTSGSFY